MSSKKDEKIKRFITNSSGMDIREIFEKFGGKFSDDVFIYILECPPYGGMFWDIGDILKPEQILRILNMHPETDKIKDISRLLPKEVFLKFVNVQRERICKQLEGNLTPAQQSQYVSRWLAKHHKYATMKNTPDELLPIHISDIVDNDPYEAKLYLREYLTTFQIESLKRHGYM